MDLKELIPNIDNNTNEFSNPGLKVKMTARAIKRNKDRFNFENLGTNGLTADNMYIYNIRICSF